MTPLDRLDGPAPRFVALALALILSSSCYPGRTRTVETIGPRESSYGTSTTVTTNRAQAQIERARQSAMDGKFADAETLLNEVYEDGSVAAKDRAEALYALGLLQLNPLNPKLDRAQALVSFEKLVAEFPDAPRRADAQREIERLR